MRRGVKAGVEDAALNFQEIEDAGARDGHGGGGDVWYAHEVSDGEVAVDGSGRKVELIHSIELYQFLLLAPVSRNYNKHTMLNASDIISLSASLTQARTGIPSDLFDRLCPAIKTLSTY